MTREPATRGQQRTLYERGTGWYNVWAEQGLKLYCDMTNLYLKAFQDTHGAFQFHGGGEPRALYGQVIDATAPEFLDSDNGSGPRQGLGFPQTEPVTVPLTDLNRALTMMAADGFATKDVEDHDVAGTVITDRNRPNHANSGTVMIKAPA